MRARFPVMVLAMLVLAPLPGRASTPQWVHLSFARPDATTSVGVAWHTDSAADPSQVEFGVSPMMNRVATGTASQGPGALKAIHEAILDELLPDTVYRYRVGGEGAWSPEFTFRTPPANVCTPYNFGVLGDNRSDNDDGPSPRWFPIISELLTREPRFILNSGDIVRDGSDVKQWANWLEASDQTLAVVPQMPTLGNHDDGPEEGDPGHYNRLFNLPRNDVTNTEDYYFFTTGNAIVVSLSTQTFKDFAAQAAWLDRVLTENPRLWKFVFFHHPTYTSSSLLGLLDISHEPNELGQNAHYTPIFDKHHVDFVFYGHNHFYERFQPMKGNGGGDEGLPVGDPAKGTAYVVTGGAGALAYNIAIGLFCGSAKGSAKCSGDHHFLDIELAGNRLTFTAHATAQQLLGYNASSSKDIETYTYTKAWPDGKDPCVVLPPEPVPEKVEADVPPEPVPEVVTDEGGLPDVPDAGDPDVPAVLPDTPADVPPPPRDEGPALDNGTPPPMDVPMPQADTGPTPPAKKGGGCTAGAVPGAALPLALLVLGVLGAGRGRRRVRSTGR